MPEAVAFSEPSLLAALQLIGRGESNARGKGSAGWNGAATNQLVDSHEGE